MKKISLLVMAVIVALSAVAQTEDKPWKQDKEHHKADRKINHDGRFEKLNLNDQQKADLKSVNENFKRDMKALHQMENITVKEQRQKQQQLAQQHKERIEAILTPEQREQAKQNMKGRKDIGERKALGKHKKGRGKIGEGRKDDFANDLNLSQEQRAKLDNYSQSLRTKSKEIREDNSLSNEQKKAQMQTLMRQHRENMNAILTNEQKQLFKERMKNRKDDDVK